MTHAETLAHRLILPADANHHGTLYAGALLRLALEAGYATAYRAVGNDANLLLRRVLSVECHHPVTIGTVIEIRGRVLHTARAYLVVGLYGTPLRPGQGPWMDGLMGFVQVDAEGRPQALPDAAGDSPGLAAEALEDLWHPLARRLQKLLSIR